MTTVLLVRHAAHDWLGKGIAGRMPEVALNAAGRQQAAELAARLGSFIIDAIYSSPQPRARETAASVAARRGLSVRADPAFDEIDFGAWTGMTFDALAAEPLWPTWVHRRSIATPPGGECFAAVQRRASDAFQRLVREHPGERAVMVVSHADVIKALLAALLGISLDHLERFDIAPASVSVLAAGIGWAQVRLVNGASP